MDEIDKAQAVEEARLKKTAKKKPAAPAPEESGLPNTVIDDEDIEPLTPPAPPAASPTPVPSAAGTDKPGAKQPEFAECEYCGKRVKKAGLGKHIANLMGDGVHPDPRDPSDGSNVADMDETEPDKKAMDLAKEPWFWALLAGIIGLGLLVFTIVFMRGKPEQQTSIAVELQDPSPVAGNSSQPQAAAEQHVSEPPVVVDADGNPFALERRPDGTFVVAVK